MELQELYNELKTYLSVPMPMDDVWPHIRGLEGLRYELLSHKVRVLHELYESRGRALYPKSKEVTDLDRKVYLEGMTAELEMDYEFLRGLEEIIKDRIELAKLRIQVA